MNICLEWMRLPTLENREFNCNQGPGAVQLGARSVNIQDNCRSCTGNWPPRFADLSCRPLAGVVRSLHVSQVDRLGLIQKVYGGIQGIGDSWTFPFREEVDCLYMERSKDEQKKWAIKIVLNSLYGKFAETIDKRFISAHKFLYGCRDYSADPPGG
jgi:hypothetical protein